MERAERADRILEAAGELLLAWGYGRVTIDEIARRAKVGKGTVYLHWKTKDALLLAVMLKAQHHTHHAQLARMRADPLEILPSRMLRGIFSAFLSEPVLRAFYTDDYDILGRLNDTAKKEFAELMAQGDRMLHRHLEVLREHGLVRDDSEILHQLYSLRAISTGFFTAESLLADRGPATAEVRADLLGQAIRSTLETPVSDPVRATAAAAAAAPEVIALHERIVELGVQEMLRQVRD